MRASIEFPSSRLQFLMRTLRRRWQGHLKMLECLQPAGCSRARSQRALEGADTGLAPFGKICRLDRATDHVNHISIATVKYSDCVFHYIRSLRARRKLAAFTINSSMPAIRRYRQFVDAGPPRTRFPAGPHRARSTDHAFEPPGMFGFDAGSTVYTRVNRLATSDGLVGYALSARRMKRTVGPFLFGEPDPTIAR
jgi:hypothetical protein